MARDREKLMDFKTGKLNAEEVELIFETLPVDITFVGKNDEVRYFNRPETRVFKRPVSVIGKKVQKCHPEKSVDKVQKILEEFRAGKRKVAEFWINLDKHIIYIRYFPVYNNSGDYTGCLEVTQDITEIKKIKGEKRLL